jgi:serine/threonine protein phosphatase 1
MASLSSSRRHWVIGDVHGCAASLEALLDQLPACDRLIFCGDVINRGPQIGATMERVWDLVAQDRAVWLKGNHEQDLVDALRLGSWRSQQGLAGCDTFRHLGERRCRTWLERLASLPLPCVCCVCSAPGGRLRHLSLADAPTVLVIGWNGSRC